MEHLIRFKTAEGIDGSHSAYTLDDAIEFVERLRNNEDATDVHLYRMTEIPIEFKTYFRVEVRQGESAQAEPHTAESPHEPQVGMTASSPVPSSSSVSRAPEQEAVEDSVVEDRPESAAANGRRLFSRT